MPPSISTPLKICSKFLSLFFIRPIWILCVNQLQFFTSIKCHLRCHRCQDCCIFYPVRSKQFSLRFHSYFCVEMKVAHLCLTLLDPMSPCIASSALCCAKLLQSYPTLCDPRNCRPPGSSVHGLLQGRIPEWVAMPSSRGSSWPWDWISYVSCLGRQVLYY